MYFLRIYRFSQCLAYPVRNSGARGHPMTAELFGVRDLTSKVVVHGLEALGVIFDHLVLEMRTNSSCKEIYGAEAQNVDRPSVTAHDDQISCN